MDDLFSLGQSVAQGRTNLKPIELHALRQSHAELFAALGTPSKSKNPKRQVTLQSQTSVRPRAPSRLRTWLTILASIIVVADLGLACAWLVRSMRDVPLHAVEMSVVRGSGNAPSLHKDELEEVHPNGPFAEARELVASEASRVCRASIQDRLRPLGRDHKSASRNARVTKPQRSSKVDGSCTM